MKLSQAFATHRQAVIASLIKQVVEENVPTFNAECEDIRRQFDKEAKDMKIGEALADHYRRSRIADMVARRTLFINSLQTELHKQQMERIQAYKGEVVKEKDGDRDVEAIHFPDQSKAKLARNLWIDYKELYDRV